MPRLAPGVVLMFALSGWVAPPPVSAQTGPRFEHVYQLGVRFYKQGQYEPALALLREAYHLRPLPRLLFNLGQAYRKLARRDEARDCFELFLRTEPQLAPAVQQEVEQYLRELGQPTAADAAAVPPGICTRGEAIAPPRAVPPPPPPPPPVALGWTAAAAPPSPPPPECVLCRRWWLWTALGTVVAGGIIAGIVLGTHSDNEPRYPMHADLTF
jgi:hypothetical protein